MSVITVTVLKEDSTDFPQSSYSLNLAIEKIEMVYPSSTDPSGFSNDQAHIEYYDDQRMSIRNYLVEETTAQIQTAIYATADTAFNTALIVKKFVNKKDSDFVSRLGLVNTQSIVRQLPQGEKPSIVDYDYGLTNHADHVRLEWCDYPLPIIGVDLSNNAITVACCVAELFPYDTSGAIYFSAANDGTYTVVSSACSEDGGQTIIVLEEPLTDDTADGFWSLT